LQRVSPEIRKLVRKQNEIADKIYRILKQRNLTQKEFAQQLGMKESQLCKILAGNANLTLKTIVKIETALNENIVIIAVDRTEYDHTITVKMDHWNTDTFPHDAVWMVPFSIDQYQLKSSRSIVADSRETYGNA